MSWRLGVGVGAAAGDLAEDDLVEHLARGDHLAPGRAGAAQQPQREVDPVVAERALEVLGRGGALAGLVGIEPEQRPHRDPHRQVAHPVVDVDDLPPSGSCAIAASASVAIAATAAAICSRWKAGIMIARARSW